MAKNNNRNRLFNCTNPYQGEAKKVLCVCSAGLLRSPTAAKVLWREHGFNTRACGLDVGHALIPIDEVLMSWADEIVCMDNRQAQDIKHMLGVLDIGDIRINVLNIPDRFSYMDEELQREILSRYEEVSNDK